MLCQIAGCVLNQLTLMAAHTSLCTDVSPVQCKPHIVTCTDQ